MYLILKTVKLSVKMLVCTWKYICQTLTLCSFEALVNSPCGSDSSPIYSPVKEKHHKHWNIKGTEC